MFYTLTLTKNVREGYAKDKKALSDVLTALCQKYHCELSDISSELTKHKPHLLHYHLMLRCDKQPYMKRLVPKGISCRLDKLKKMDDVNRWIGYCHKMDHRRHHFTIEDDYEESTVPNISRLK